ncbi:hypothetical protein [Streptomyces sp. MBT27]|uniref:hypothetical protein n=1 Tax=Streptomyces sp. MBT27 TaxID=1488356 RepID=UPI00142190AE|nr:hypothetical protein [Streptomyces sp. MBT27]
MAKGRKARRNAVARAATTAELPIAAYREMRAAHAPFEGYTIDVHHIVDAVACPGEHHHADLWSYWVRDRAGRCLNWVDVNAETPVKMAPRYRHMLYGSHLPLETDALRARFPGARITVHATRPETCAHDFAACWVVHRDCEEPCEVLDAQRETEAQVDAEETWRAAIAAWNAEGDAMNVAHQSEIEAMEQREAALKRTDERRQAAVNAGQWDLLGSDPELASYFDDLTACWEAESERARRHRQEWDEWWSREPARPEHWREQHEAA